MKTKEQLQERALSTAIGHFLGNFPDGKTNEELLELIAQDSDDISFWFPFEDSDNEWVLERIELMQQSLMQDLKWAQEGE